LDYLKLDELQDDILKKVFNSKNIQKEML